MTGPAQLTFELELRPMLSEDNFYLAGCNASAFAFITGWRAWSAPAGIIHGPAGSGKSHLARIWQGETGARLLPASALRLEAPLAGSCHLVIEDADRGGYDERALFHALNLAREHGTKIFFTARTAPGGWPIALADLRSRVRSYPAIAIEAPDDELLAAVLLKHFSDRQLIIAPDVIPFMLARMERSMEAAQELVAHIDKAALAEHRKVTRAFVAKVMETVPVLTSSADSRS